MYYLNLDENNYLLSIASIGGGTNADINLSDYDFSGVRINAYKWENGVLKFDEDRLAILEEERTIQEETDNNQVSQEERIADLEKALELLLSGGVE